jgi:hypothetical protein
VPPQRCRIAPGLRWAGRMAYICYMQLRSPWRRWLVSFPLDCMCFPATKAMEVGYRELANLIF